MNNIKRFLNLYLNRKLRIESIIFILNISIILTIYLTFLILIEKTAFLTPEIKTKNLNKNQNLLNKIRKNYNNSFNNN